MSTPFGLPSFAPSNASGAGKASTPDDKHAMRAAVANYDAQIAVLESL